MKKYLSLLLVLACLFVFTGCGKKDANKKEVSEISYELGKGVITLSVEKVDGKPKHEFTTTKPEGMNKTGSVYLETDKAIISFATSGMTYHTAVKYKEKYGEVDPTFDDYLKWKDDPDSGIKLAGSEVLEYNGRKFFRYYRREGGGGQYTYFGYNYLVGVDDVYPGSRLEMAVQYKETEFPTESKEIDDETLEIIKSIKISAKKNN